MTAYLKVSDVSRGTRITWFSGTNKHLRITKEFSTK